MFVALWELLDSKKEEDLIKKACVIRLKNQMEEMLKCNIPEGFEDFVMNQKQ